MVPTKTTRLKSQSYKKSGQTYTEKLTDDEIREKLIDYKKVEDISKVPIGTHLRYFAMVNGKQKFRMGGFLTKLGLPDYVILNNNKNSWSTQLQNCVFFKKMTIAEIKEDYEQYIEELEEKNKKLKIYIQKLKNNMNHNF